MATTAQAIKKAKSTGKAYKISDGNGLYCLVSTNGSKSWRFNYRFGDKQKTITYGTFPEVSLADARTAHAQARVDIRRGVDPMVQRKVQRDRRAGKDAFESIAREWHAFAAKKRNWSETTTKQHITRMEQDLFPHIGNERITEITAPMLLRTLRRVEARGAIEIANRLHGVAQSVFSYAIGEGKAELNIAIGLSEQLQNNETTHHSAITDPDELARLLTNVEKDTGSLMTKIIIKTTALVFLRSSEIRFSKWSNIDFDNRRWVLEADQMKGGRRGHVVPLSGQVITLLRQLYELTYSGEDSLIFTNDLVRPVSENTVNKAIRRMGHSSTCHGFRSTASTMLREQLKYPHHLIELQLAHRIGNSVSQAYNHAEHLEDRAEMMQGWADYLDALRTGSNVVAMGKQA